MTILRAIILSIVIFGWVYGGDAETIKITVVENQKSGPTGNEWIIERTNVSIMVTNEILKDVGNQIKWAWTRIMLHNDSYILIGNIKMAEADQIAGVVYRLSKIDGKWALGADSRKIVLPR